MFFSNAPITLNAESLLVIKIQYILSIDSDFFLSHPVECQPILRLLWSPKSIWLVQNQRGKWWAPKLWSFLAVLPHTERYLKKYRLVNLKRYFQYWFHPLNHSPKTFQHRVKWWGRLKSHSLTSNPQVIFFDDGTKLKMPSEINPPLATFPMAGCQSHNWPDSKQCQHCTFSSWFPHLNP